MTLQIIYAVHHEHEYLRRFDVPMSTAEISLKYLKSIPKWQGYFYMKDFSSLIR